VFSGEVILSIIGQFVTHLASLLTVLSFVGTEKDASVPTSGTDAPFAPNPVNTAVFLIACAMQTTTFAVNYRGRPFMESLVENKGLCYSLSIAACGTLLLASELLPEFNTYMELVPLAVRGRSVLLGVMVADFIVSFLWDRGCRWAFSGRR